MNLSRLFGGLLMLISLVGCQREADAPAPADPKAQATAQEDTAIDWFKGDVNEAFARARAENKPVLLLWSAEWCPPCHKLKAGIFKRPDFIAKTRLFVPVYLDGDEEGGQKAAEEFHVAGYPTVVILSPEREELARISGGMDLNRYAEVLDLALGDARPVKTILASLQNDASELSADDCRRLAYNEWLADDQITDDLDHAADALALAASRCPTSSRIERARLQAVSTYAAVAAAENSGTPTPAQNARLKKDVSAIAQILAEPTVARGAADYLAYLGTDFFAAAKRVDAQAKSLRDPWIALMEAVSVDPNRATADQLMATVSKLRAIKSFAADDKLPADAVQLALQKADAALADTPDEHSRSAVVNSVLWIYDAIGDKDRAYALLEHEVATSRYPYYYLADLASLEEERDNKDKALELLKRAYEESKGAATRFQWGTDYVFGLLRMRPQDDAAIRDASLAVLGELDGPDRIYSRSRVRLDRLNTRLLAWNEKNAHAQTIAVLRTRMNEICAHVPADQPASATCAQFLLAKS